MIAQLSHQTSPTSSAPTSAPDNATAIQAITQPP